MEQLAVVARLKQGAEPEALKLVAEGPPFELEGSGLERHEVYVSAGEVVFVFEGDDAEWVVDALVDDPLQWPVIVALDAWRPLVEGTPRLARGVFAWQRTRQPA
jgi:hypothetical protein